MIKILINEFKSMEEKIKRLMNYGFIFSFFVCLISMICLITYSLNLSLGLYYIGLSIFRLSLFLAVEFIISAIAINTIIKQIP